MSAFLPWFYLLRVPLTFGILLAVFAPVALCRESPGRTFLEGLFDLRPFGVVLATVAAPFAATACAFSSWLVLRYGAQRFGVQARGGWTAKRWRSVVHGFEIDLLGALLAAGYGLAAVSLIAGVVVKVRQTQGYTPWIPILAGMVVFAILVGVACAWWAWSLHAGGWLARCLVFTGKGYLECDGACPRLLTGHGFGIRMALVSHLVYAFLGYRLWFTDPDGVAAPKVATLVCLLLLLALGCWTLSALAFFFDGFRTPVLLPLAVLVVVASQWPESDHFFAVTVLPRAPGTLYPDAVLDACGDGCQSDAAIVVAASGGGIQAAAWTAKVLVALRADIGRDFTASLRLISAVSGGSAGALQFLGAWTDGDLRPERLLSVINGASDPVLDEVVQGMIYPDLVRFVLPFFVPHRAGRGHAMDAAWTRRGTFPPRLSDWRAEVAAGTRPAVIFNATVVETGERLMLATVDFARPPKSGTARGTRTFGELYAGLGTPLDVSPATAARLSATFPYVSPAARADFRLPPRFRYHLVDGGYYDNSGVSSVVDFLDQVVLQRPARRVRRILVIQIRDRAASDGPGRAAGSRGGVYQAFAPIRTLLGVRDSAQVSHAATELRLLQIAATRHGVDVQTVDFEYPKREAPLSWYLDQNQLREISASWESRYAASPERCAVRTFLGIAGDTTCQTMPSFVPAGPPSRS